MDKKNNIKAAAVTVSDSRATENDISGATLAALLIEAGAEIVEKTIVSDDFEEIVKVLENLSSREDINLIITTGGTGFAPRDNTPEATRAVIERETPGIAEEMRRRSAERTPFAILSRGICGIRGKCLIINLPGAPKAVTECFEIIKPVLNHAVKILSGDTEHND